MRLKKFSNNKIQHLNLVNTTRIQFKSFVLVEVALNGEPQQQQQQQPKQPHQRNNVHSIELHSTYLLN